MGTHKLPVVFLDVDGPLIPFGGSQQQYPDGYPTFGTDHESLAAGANPLLARLDPRLGTRLAALPGDLVWATTWMAEANEWVAPRLGLPALDVVMWPEPSDIDEHDERRGLHWKTRTLVEWAAGHPFAWVDDEITDSDRAWVADQHPGNALLHRVDPRSGLTAADLDALEKWLRSIPSSG